MVSTVNAAGHLIRESAAHIASFAGSGAALSFAAIPIGRLGRVWQKSHRVPKPLPRLDHAAVLCELTSHITQVDMHREPGEQLADLVQSAFAMEAVAIFDMDLNRTYRAGQWFADPENNLRNICMFERSASDPETGLVSEVVRIGSLPIGALLLRGEIDNTVAAGIANLIAVTFDRYHSRANLSRVESARETERLRSTVLDSLAHTYKTPLTAIRAAATGVIEIGSLSSAQSELMGVIEEQSAVLNDLTMRLLTTARLENHDISLHLETVSVAPLLDDVIAALHAHFPNAAVQTTITPEDLALECDRSLVSTLLTQFVDNAAKYSTFDTIITLSAHDAIDTVLFSVHNFGPAIPESEHERIFERYARGAASSANTSGTGIGLSIARAAAQAHGGDAWLKSDAVEGTTFWASIPVRRRRDDDDE